MTTYTADDFKNARFATNRDGRIAVRFYTGHVTADYPWAVIGSRSTVANPYVRDSHMTNAGWVPVQENPRPLAADELTDDAIRRARVAWLENAQHEGCPSAPTIRAMFAAALTPPPSRPEGAEDIQEFIVPVQENPRPLTADDRSRAYEAFHEVWGRTGTLTREAVNAALDAALTEPTRPKGAEELQALIRQAEADGEGADNEALANYLAAHLTDPTVKEQS